MVKIHPKIGTKAYALHNKYVKESPLNGKIIPCKIETYQNANGKVVPLYVKLKGQELNNETHTFYTTLEEAIQALSSKPKKK